MITHFHTGLTRVRVTPPGRQGNQYRVRMQFRVIDRPEAVEIDATAEELMNLVQTLLAALPAPAPPPTEPPPQPKRKKPALHIVRDDEGG